MSIETASIQHLLGKEALITYPSSFTLENIICITPPLKNIQEF